MVNTIFNSKINSSISQWSQLSCKWRITLKLVSPVLPSHMQFSTASYQRYYMKKHYLEFCKYYASANIVIGYIHDLGHIPSLHFTSVACGWKELIQSDSSLARTLHYVQTFLLCEPQGVCTVPIPRPQNIDLISVDHRRCKTISNMTINT